MTRCSSTSDDGVVVVAGFFFGVGLPSTDHGDPLSHIVSRNFVNALVIVA